MGNFTDRLKQGYSNKRREDLPNDKKAEIQAQKVEQVFRELAEKSNRFLFYCPDIPFATSLMRTVYQIAKAARSAGYNAIVLHEVPGFNPTSFLKEQWVKDIPVEYIQKKKSKEKISTTFSFEATDTVIIPEGFWSVMESFYNTHGIQKVVLAVGYGGLISTPAGASWTDLGFTHVICTNNFLMQEYKQLWPWMDYSIIPYYIEDNAFIPVDRGEVYPAVALSCRSREMANMILNVFYNKYPYLNMVDFKIMKRLNTKEFEEVMSYCSSLVLVDEFATDCPTPYEALKLNIPAIIAYGKGYEEYAEKVKDINDCLFFVNPEPYEIADAIATFYMQWFTYPNLTFDSKTVLETKSAGLTQSSTSETFAKLQDNRIQHFTAIKEAVEKSYSQNLTSQT